MFASAFVAILVAQSSPAQAPADPGPAIALVRQAQEREAWIDALGSCSARWEAWEFRSLKSRTPGQPAIGRLDLDQRIEALRSRSRDRKLDIFDLTLSLDLWPEGASSSIGEIAYDRQRYRESLVDQGRATMSVTSAEDGFEWTRFPSGSSSLVLFGGPASPTPPRFRGWDWSFWPRIGEHHFWWTSSSTPAPQASQFRPLGPIEVDGRTCVQVTDGDARRYIIEPESGNLVAFVLYGVDDLAPRLEIINEIRSRRALPPLARLDQYSDWYQSLGEGEQAAVNAEQLTALEPYRRPRIVNRFGDWREVRPGHRVPLLQSMAFFDDLAKTPTIESIRLTRFTEFSVDQPLPEGGWEAPPRVDGMRITDARFDPPIEWVHPKEPSDDEKRAIADRTAKQLAEAAKHESQQKLLIGTPAPEFPAAGPGGVEWVVDGPLTAADFRGKVTIVVFFATWCGPCRQELAHTRGLIERRANNEVQFIGVHASGTPADAVLQFVKDVGFAWPTVIDAPDPAQRGFGQIARLYRVRGIPEAYLIDSEGTIVGFGDMERLYREGVSLARQRNARPGRG